MHKKTVNTYKVECDECGYSRIEEYDSPEEAEVAFSANGGYVGKNMALCPSCWAYVSQCFDEHEEEKAGANE
jgi:hypothetical protein